MNRLAFIIQLFAIVLTTTFASCDEPDNLSITMSDGQKIILKNETPCFYESESEFVSNTPINIPCEYSFLSNNGNAYYVGGKYQIGGFDDRFIGQWEKASFGNWIADYGLIPNKEYYCAWIKYVLYLPIQDNADYIPIFPMENMGYVSWTERPCFDVEYRKGYPKEIIYTYVRYIGYDENKIGTYKEIPTLNKLIWNFTLKD